MDTPARPAAHNAPCSAGGILEHVVWGGEGECGGVAMAVKRYNLCFFKPQMNADIPANFRLYHNFCCVIEIKIHNYLYLYPSAVNIEMIASPHSFLHSPAPLPFDT